MEPVDYIIIGGGSAGCVLAARLSAEPACRITLLEAGGEDRNPLIHIPAGFIKTMVNPALNWMFESEPEPGTGNRRIAIPPRQGTWRLIGDQCDALCSWSGRRL